MSDFDLSTYPIGIEPQGARVWTSPNWSTGFTYRPDLLPTHSTFASGGNVSTATLDYRFGRVLLPGASALEDYAEITARGYFVLIEWINDDGSILPWLGYAEAPVTLERYHGDDETPEGGRQSIPCFGFERILEQTYITSTVHADPVTSEPTRKPYGATFNPSSTRGNQHTDGIFANPLDDDSPSFWSTRDIVDHLFRWHLPTIDGSIGSIPWSVDSSLCPTWDKPRLETNDRSVADCLSELCSADRLLGWKIEPFVNAGGLFVSPTITSVRVIPYTLTPTSFSLPSVGTVSANPNLVNLTTIGDPNTELENKSLDSTDTVDQVIVRGPREIAVATLRTETNNGPLEKGWVEEKESEFDAGGSVAAVFNEADQWEQRELNDRLRNSPEFADVYRLLRIKKDWGGKADGSSVFYKPESESDDHDPYLGNVEILPKLPLFAEIDYTSGEVSEVDESEGKSHLSPIILLQEPGDPNLFIDPTGELNLDVGFRGRNGAYVPFSVSARVENDRGPAIRLNTAGAPTHALAGPTFTGNDADTDQEVFGAFSYDTISATVAIKSDRNPSYAIPSQVSGLDVVRRKIITIDHPSLELVHIAPDTVVGLNVDGTRKQIDGGLLRDPFPLLEALAALASTRQLQPKHSAEIKTARRLPIRAGSILRTLNGDTIDAVIKEVSISAKITNNNLDVSQTIKASTSAIDVLKLMKASR